MIRLSPSPRGSPPPRRPSPYAPERLEPRTLLATFVVTTEADDGPGSLRQAMLDANATPASDVIQFAIPGEAGVVPTIRPLSALPEVTAPVSMNALRPTGGTTPRVNLDGSAAGPGVDGLVVRAGGSTIQGLAVHSFSGNGVAVLSGARAQVGLCYIGLTAGGAPAGNGGAGVFTTSPAATIGGSGVFEQPLPNVISANAGPGVLVVNARDPVPGLPPASVSHNRIGTSVDGERALPNGGGGVMIENSPGTGVGSNTISGNALFGVRIVDSPGAEVTGNRIGTNAAGTAPVPNDGPGVVTAGPGTQIGFENVLVPNIISGNRGAGVAVLGNDSAARITNNRIFANEGLGIDLGGDGVTPNDPLDADTGPNRRQNAPVIARVTETGGQVAVTVRLHSVPIRNYRIELFRSPRPDASGHGEGERYLNAVSVTTDPAGNAQAVITVSRAALPATTWLSATATDEGARMTSEFSAAVSALGGRPVFRPSPPSTPGGAAAPTTILLEAPARRGTPPPRGLLT